MEENQHGYATRIDDKVWTVRTNNQTPNASIKKNENPNSLLRDREMDTIKKALKSLRSASQQFPPPNTQINKLKRLNFPLGKEMPVKFGTDYY